MLCPKCGNELLEDSLFCNKCGEKILVEEIKKVNSNDISIIEQTHVKEKTHFVMKKIFIFPVLGTVLFVLYYIALNYMNNNGYKFVGISSYLKYLIPIIIIIILIFPLILMAFKNIKNIYKNRDKRKTKNIVNEEVDGEAKNGKLGTVMKKSKKVQIIAIIMGVLVLLGIISTIRNNMKYSDLVKQADISMSSKEYSKAMDLYNEALTIKNGTDINSKLSKAKVFKESSINFKKGMDSFGKHNYVDAIVEFNKIPKEDTTNYNSAISKVKQSIELFTAYNIKYAKQSASKKNYDIANTFIVDALKYDPNNKQLKELETTYEKQAKAEQSRLDAIAQAKIKAEAEAKDKNRTESIYQMKLKLSNNDFDGAKSTLSYVLFSEDEITTIEVYIDGKQEYLNEIEDDANHPEYKVPKSKYNYIGVKVKLADINPQYQGIYSNEIKDYVHKFMNDDEWKKAYNDAVESNTKIENQINAPVPSIGMTAEEVRASRWGNPDKVNRTTTTYGTSEQWVYSNYGYVYLDKGVVTSIQE